MCATLHSVRASQLQNFPIAELQQNEQTLHTFLLLGEKEREREGGREGGRDVLGWTKQTP